MPQVCSVSSSNIPRHVEHGTRTALSQHGRHRPQPRPSRLAHDIRPLNHLRYHSELHRHHRILVVLDDIAFLDRKFQIRPVGIREAKRHARPPLLRTPPRREHARRFGLVKVRIKVRSRVLLLVDPPLLAHERILILDAQPVGIDDVGKSLGFGLVVEEALLLDSFQCVGGGAAALATLRRGGAAALLVGRPVGFLAVSGAVAAVLAFGAAL